MSLSFLNELPIWQQNHLNVCIEKDLFKDKKVLEVGGQTPYQVCKSLGVKSWVCVDPIIQEDKVFDESYKHYKASILDFDKEKDFDLIFSTNAFEHIEGLDIGIKNMYNLLKKGGKLSALFGPIWSCYKGHHIYCPLPTGGIIDFNNVKLSGWEHLVFSEKEFENELVKNYDKKTAFNISYGVYNRKTLNKLLYDDYKNIIDNSGFKILEFRDWHTSKYPSVELQKELESKYNNKNFSTVSIKILIEK